MIKVNATIFVHHTEGLSDEEAALKAMQMRRAASCHALMKETLVYGVEDSIEMYSCQWDKGYAYGAIIEPLLSGNKLIYIVDLK